MKRGTKIGKIQRGLLCADVIGGDIKWRASGKVNWSNEELTDVFREELESNGWPVVGSTDDLFAGWDVSGAEILIGAKIAKIEATVCFGPVNIFHPNGTSKGAVRLDVEWQIYNPSRKALIGTFYSSGSHEEKSKSEDGHLFLMETAFANAANNLLASRDFLNLVKRSDEVVAAPSGDSTIIPNVKQKPTTLEMILERAQKSTVVIRTAVGHGSGFSIGDGTLLLTNAHVVGEAQNVAVILSGGFEVSGSVVSKDKARDVALIEMKGAPVPPLHISGEEVLLGQTAYALGAPLKEELSGSVTKRHSKFEERD